MYFALNTTIPLKKLSDIDLDSILDSYRSCDFIIAESIPQFNSKHVRDYMKSHNCYEFTPNISLPDNKLVLSQKYAKDNKPYIHVQLIPNDEPDSKVEALLLKFDSLIRSKLYR